RDPYEGISVDIESKLNPDAEYVLRGRNVAAVCAQIGDVRSLGYAVGSDPLPENPAHGGVWREGKVTKKDKMALLGVCEWFLEMAGVRIA
ncbi:MAG: hypothetical protein ACLFQ5_02895, partial [Oceanicaulis sp.]